MGWKFVWDENGPRIEWVSKDEKTVFSHDLSEEFCAAYTLFGRLDDKLKEDKTSHWNFKKFKEEYDSLREQGIEGVIGSEDNRYGIFQNRFLAEGASAQHNVGAIQGDFLYKALVDIVYNHPKAGAIVTWLFQSQPLKGIWTGCLDADIEYMLEHPEILERRREIASTQPDDYRHKAFLSGTEKENLDALRNEKEFMWINPVYTATRAVKATGQMIKQEYKS